MSSPLRVTHVALSLDVGGLERNILNQIREGSRLGQKVSVICLERRGVLADQAESLGAPVICLDKKPGLRPELLRPMRRVLRSLRPHVVHTHQIASLLYTGLAVGTAGVPVVVHTEHGKEHYAQRLRTRWLGRLAGRYAARFFCLSEDMAAAVRAHRIVPSRKVRVVLNGIDTARFNIRGDPESLRQTLGIPQDATIIGTVGRLTPVKRQDLLIKAFAQVRRQLPQTHLLLVGEGPLLPALQRLVADLDVDLVTHFVGYQPEPHGFLHLMDVFVLTSVSEGIPQALLEASVAGVPAVASRVGGVPEVIEADRTGLLFPSENLDALTEAILNVLRNPDPARERAEAARIRVESLFHIRRMAHDYHQQFLELLRHKPPCTFS
jgi:glycosyltransferase involved in cell wall biosynthesis